MKRIFCLLTVVLLVSVSCSNDNNDSSNSLDSILVKAVKVTNGDKLIEQKITYDGNKIVSIIWEGGFRNNYTYTGNLITKVEDFDGLGNLVSGTEYKYDNGKLYSSLSYDFNFHVRYEYKYLAKFIHNEDGTVSYQNYKVNPRTGEEEQKNYLSGKYFFKNGNLVRDEWYSYSKLQSATVYQYDNKNNHFKNITGYNLLLDLMPSVNNVVKFTSTGESGVVYETFHFYQYNAKGYPIKKWVDVVDGVPFSIVEYRY